MFRAQVLSELNPILIKRYPDGHQYNNCLLTTQGAVGWRPLQGDVVLADEVDGYVFIFAKCNLPDDDVDAGTNIGNSQTGDGVNVSDNGLLTTIKAGVNKVEVDELGVHIDTTEIYEMKGSGYINTVFPADAANDGNLTTVVEEIVAQPIPSMPAQRICRTEIDQAGTITMTVVLEAVGQAYDSYSMSVTNEGNVETIVKDSSGEMKDIVTSTTRKFGSGPANDPFVRLSLLNSYLKAILELYDSHTNVGAGAATPLSTTIPLLAAPLEGSSELFLTK